MKHLGKGSRTQVAPQAQAAARLKSDGGRATPYVCVWEEDADARGCITDLQCRTATRRARASAEQQTEQTQAGTRRRAPRADRARPPHTRGGRRGPAVWVCGRFDPLYNRNHHSCAWPCHKAQQTHGHMRARRALSLRITHSFTAHAHSHTGAAAGTRARAAARSPRRRRRPPYGKFLHTY